MRTVLIVDDNPGVGEALALALSLRDIRPLVALSPEQGLALLEREHVDLVIQDMNFSADTTSGEEGVALFRAIRARHVDVPVVLLTAWTRLESAVELVKAGAADYLAKPWDDAKLLATVENLLELAEAGAEMRRVRTERRARKQALAARYELGGLVAESDATLRPLELACQVARSAVPVLITGPNGSGKERIAAIVHANSEVARGPFVALNCGALPAELIEAELFGAESGAYTGANKARPGRFDAADGGTLFLDELGTLPVAAQAKLLRVLQTGEFERLGSSTTRKANVRLISATNVDLPRAIAAGQFREDLYFRLNVIELFVPPLADRPDDILPLAEHFLTQHLHKEGKGPLRLGDEARAALLNHEFSGNVRELQNRIQRAVLVEAADLITAAALGLPAPRPDGRKGTPASPAPTGRPGGPGPRPAPTDPASVEERTGIEEALLRAGGVVAKAAAEMGLSRQALYRRMERLGIVMERRPR